MKGRASGLRTSSGTGARNLFVRRRGPAHFDTEATSPGVQSDDGARPTAVFATIARWVARHPLLTIALPWLALVLVIDPRGEFPLNDDWAYALPVAHLVETGQLRLTFWQSMPLFSQFLWGALFCLPQGFSFLALRCSTLTLGLFGLWALYLLLRDGGVTPRRSFLAVSVLLINPIYTALSFSFMSDVPFVALFTLAAWQLMRALEQPSKTSLLLGFGFALVATLVRQIGVVLPLAFALASLPRWGLTVRWLRSALLPLVLIAAVLPASRTLLELTIGVPGLYDVRDQSLKQALSHLAQGRLGVVRMALHRTHELLLYLGLFLLPLTASLLLGEQTRARPHRRLVLAGAATLFVGLSIVCDMLVPDPLFGNVLTTRGIGPALSPDESGSSSSAPAWILTGLASLGIAGLVASVLPRMRAPSVPKSVLSFVRAVPPRRIFLIAASILGFAPFALAYGPLFDRHMLFLFPMVMAIVLELGWQQPSRLVTLFTFLLVSLGALGTTLSVHDYLAWNRARWLAAAQVADAQTLDGGAELNNYLAHRASMQAGRAGPTALLDRSDAPYALRESSTDTESVIGRVPVSRWLPTTPREILVIARRD